MLSEVNKQINENNFSKNTQILNQSKSSQLVKKKVLKNVQKAWRIVAHDHFKQLQ